MNDFFRLRVNVDDVARQLGTTADLIANQVTEQIKKISVNAHQFIVNKSAELSDTKRAMYLGFGQYGNATTKTSDKFPGINPKYKNLTWSELSPHVWVVELNKEAAWLEEGRPITDMATPEWLLKPGKVKTAKDGSTYRSIPIGKMKGNKPTFDTGTLGEGAGGQVLTAIKKAARQQLVSLSKIEKEGGVPKLGVLHQLNVKAPFTRLDHPEWFSKPREKGSQEAVETGLKPYKGAFHLQGAVVMQRKDKETGKITKETVAFRTVSSKHKGHRWMAPAQAPLGFFKDAYDNAEKEWQSVIQAIDAQLKGL